MQETQQNESNYSAKNIQVLEGLEAVRKRPAMYIGDISEKGLHHLVNETVDNSIDEAMAGYCTHIEVTINEDNSITVQDNGRGIPVDEHKKLHKSALEVVMTVLHAGGKFDKGSYKVSGGLHGVGVSCVNALSSRMLSQVFRDGKIYQQEYEKGHALYPVRVVGSTDKQGTRQQFWPDKTIFTTTVYQYDIIARRMRELAYLNAGITITLTDLRPDDNGNTRQEVFHAKEGLKEFVRFIDRHRTHLFDDVIYLKTEKQGIPIEVAVMYNTDYAENIHSYVNNINTIEGGTHLMGFRMALTRTLKKYADNDPVISKQIEKAKIEIAGEDFREGISRLVSGECDELSFRKRWNKGTDEHPDWGEYDGTAILERENGQPRYIFHAFKDITRQVQQEIHDQEMANFYMKAFETNLVAMSFYDADGYFIDANPKMRELCQLDGPAGRFYRETCLFDIPDSKAFFDQGVHNEFHMCQRLLIPELSLDKYVETRIKSIVDDEGNVVYFVVSSRDVTAERDMYMKQREHDRLLF